MKIFVSACLLGRNCKYNGGNNYNEELEKRLEGCTIIPICPEVEGGLPVPRNPVEIAGGFAKDRDGNDYTSYFLKGAESVMKRVREEKPDALILQSRSPSCGKGLIYDGSFTSRLIEGNGFFVQLLIKEGYKVFTPNEFISFSSLDS